MGTIKQSVIGGKDKGSEFDLTHSETPTSTPITPRIKLKTSKEPITIDPQKTALVSVDTQNYFLSPSLGRTTHSVSLRVVDKLIKYAIPACRQAGLKDDDIQSMPPMMVATTGDDSNFDGKKGGGSYGEELGKVTINGKEVDAGIALMRDQWNTELYAPLDQIRLPEDLLLYKNRARTSINVWHPHSWTHFMRGLI